MTLKSRWSNSPYRVESVQRILCVGTIFQVEIGCKTFYNLFMKSYNLALDIKRILEIKELSFEDLSFKTGLSRMSLESIASGYNKYSKDTIERIYSFLYTDGRGVNLNKSKEMLFRDDANGKILLFHGAKGDIEGDVDTHHSVPPNDFGDGFYTGESLDQAASWVAKYENSSVYGFYLPSLNELKIKKYNANREWLYVVLYFRGAFNHFEITDEIKHLVNDLSNCDLVIAPIADNEMFKTIDSFIRNEITDEACIHALAASNLGTQYVFKSDKACSKLEFIDRLYLCSKEKNDYLLTKEKLSSEGVEKAKLALVEYRRKGLYFDELFKRKG